MLALTKDGILIGINVMFILYKLVQKVIAFREYIIIYIDNTIMTFRTSHILCPQHLLMGQIIYIYEYYEPLFN